MKRLLAIALTAAAILSVASVAQAGTWQQHAGYWYYYDDQGGSYYYDGTNYYLWTNGQWEFYAPWNSGGSSPTTYAAPYDGGYDYSSPSYGYSYPSYGYSYFPYRTYRYSPGIGSGRVGDGNRGGSGRADGNRGGSGNRGGQGGRGRGR